LIPVAVLIFTGGEIMTRRTLAALIIAAPLVLAPSPALATASTNAVITWDLNAQTAIWDVGRQLPWVQGRSFAMVNGAVYDAVNAIAGTPYQPYLVAPEADGNESTDAAVATAAFRVLDAILPAQHERLQAQYDETLAAVPDGVSKQEGIAVGDQAAAAMIAARVDDGVSGDQQWVIGTQPGQWRPTPPDFLSAGASAGHMKPFLIPSASQFRTAGPLPLTSHAYARELNEIKAIGSASSTVRTADQTEAAIWWHDRRLTEWEIKRQLAETQRLSVLQTARMFAMVDLSGADTAIACFVEKERWSFWRPVTAIQEAGTDGNPRTTADPQWTPLLVTPPFPDHPSGHACGTGSRMTTLRTFFGNDRIAFSASSVDTGTTRHFSSFSQAIAELVEARVWGGIHFRTADTQGVDLGVAVSRYVTRNHFRPVR
jgi:hypothetical protein